MTVVLGKERKVCRDERLVGKAVTVAVVVDLVVAVTKGVVAE